MPWIRFLCEVLPIEGAFLSFYLRLYTIYLQKIYVEYFKFRFLDHLSKVDLHPVGIH